MLNILFGTTNPRRLRGPQIYGSGAPCLDRFERWHVLLQRWDNVRSGVNPKFQDAREIRKRRIPLPRHGTMKIATADRR
jgi:hypothetical protein